MKLFDIIRIFTSKGHTYILDRYDKFSVYSGSFEDCLKTLNQESPDFRKKHIIVSEKKYSRIIRRKPIL